MRAKDLFQGLTGEMLGDWEDLVVKNVTDDSREISKDSVFFCRQGEKEHGLKYVDEAIRQGAVIVVSEKRLGKPVAQFIADNVEDVSVSVLRRFYRDADRWLFKIGVTGTNGKTTVCYLIKSGFDRFGYSFGIISTVRYEYGAVSLKPKNTTPGLFQLWKIMHEMRREGVFGFSMEVSSHALKQKRIGDLTFDVGVFTNLSRDHLDYHISMEDYFQSKFKLFKYHVDGVSVVNVDDDWGRVIVSNLKEKMVITYGMESGDIKGRIVSGDLRGMEIEVDGIRVNTTLLGKHNLYNILAAYAVFHAWDMGYDFLRWVVPDFKPVKGRLKRIEANGITVFVDYAHTPDALAKVLESLRSLTQGKIITVFGCGGDRDKGKRPEMGRVASMLSDFIVITSDNPRSEDPEAIVDDILEGVDNKNYYVEIDRAKAIEFALKIAAPGDVVLVAGKGHEDYQIIGDKVVYFDDEEVVRRVFAGLKVR